jgi:hypothetical protein
MPPRDPRRKCPEADQPTIPGYIPPDRMSVMEATWSARIRPVSAAEHAASPFEGGRDPCCSGSFGQFLPEQNSRTPLYGRVWCVILRERAFTDESRQSELYILKRIGFVLERLPVLIVENIFILVPPIIGKLDPKIVSYSRVESIS